MGDAASFRFPIRPRFYEIDQQGVVFNAWYLAYFDEAMAAFLARCGIGVPELNTAGYDTYLVHTELDWSQPLRPGDSAQIAVRVQAVGRTSFTLGFEVLRDGVTTCRARTVYVVVETGTWSKTAVPDLLRRPLEAGPRAAEADGPVVA